MSSIFNILESDYKLVALLEENGGEITPEIEEQLKINADEVEKKIKSFYGLIKTFEAEIGVIKAEKERLNTIQKVKENTIERLKNFTAQLLIHFGTIGKSGNYQLNYDTLKVYSKEYKGTDIKQDIIFSDLEGKVDLLTTDANNIEELQKLVTENKLKAQKYIDIQIELSPVGYEQGQKLIQELNKLKAEYNTIVTGTYNINKEKLKADKPSEYITETSKTIAVFK